MLVSHDQHLIEACVLEVWLCKEGTVKRLNSGLKEYRDEIQGQSSNSIDIGNLLRGWREERSFMSANIHSTNGISRCYVLHATMVCAVHVLGEVPTGTHTNR